MIRQAIAEEDLWARIRAHDPRWAAKARIRTAKFRRAKKYDEASPIWSDIKPVFMTLQHNKCAFCERRLEGPPFGQVEHDVEHFRPKSGVRAWPDERIRRARSIDYTFRTGKAHAPGYYLLAYSPLNYVTACKPCNTPLKSNFFPIAGKRGRPADDPRRYASERPFLVYPLGDVDAEAPDELITFRGMLPVPVHASGDRYRRAVVIIDFFELDTRESLLRERSLYIMGYYNAWRAQDHQAMNVLLRPAQPHLNCTRAFAVLCNTDPAEARRQYELVVTYIESQS